MSPDSATTGAAADSAARPPSAMVDYPRLISISDGVFAIALTLLVLDIRIPSVPAGQLASALIDLAPRLASYLLAFLVIASHWDGHQRTFLCLRGADNIVLWLNLARLLFVTLIPASTAILGSYPLEPLAVACFGANTTLLGMAGLAMWWRVLARRTLLRDGIRPATVQLITWIWVMNPIVFAISIPVAFINVYVAFLLWILVPASSYVGSWRYARRLAAPAARPR